MESDGVCLAFSIDTVFIEDCIRVPDVFTSPKLIYLLSSDIEESAGLFKSNSTVEIYNTTSKKQNIYNFNGVAKKVYSYGNIIAIDLGSEVLFINMNGWLIKKYNSAQDIKNIVLTDNLAGIVYRDKIEFINL